MNQIVALWAPPRSRSTAFLRMVIERGDFTVIHEPFCSLFDDGFARLPDKDGNETIIDTCEGILNHIFELSKNSPVFFKDSCEYSYDAVLDHQDALKRITHTFLIRNLRDTIHSHFKIHPAVTCAQIGYQNVYRLMHMVTDLTSKPPIVVDADLLVDSPEKVVKMYCQHIDIPFLPQSLSWTPETRREWGRTPNWHVDVSDSSGFSKSSKTYETCIENNSKLRRYYNYHLPFFEKLKSVAIVLD